MRNIVILTGAGISAESGLSTFRAEDGLWCEHRVEDVATPEGFARDPELVQRFYNMRREQLKTVEPNAAHLALADLAEQWDGNILLVTQNVDDLHDRAHAGRRTKAGFELLHMHGELKKVRCMDTDNIYDWSDDITGESMCACCLNAGTLRPHIVWFGEMPVGMIRIGDALQNCDLFVSIGTSGNVYPAAGFVQEAKMRGRARTVELNLEPSSGYTLFDETRYGPATKLVPEFVRQILSER